MNQTYLLIGGNMGNRQENLEVATRRIAANIGEIKQSSAIYETEAWGLEEQPAFLNQVLLVSSTLNAQQVLKQILNIEHDMGRERIQKFGPRIIDIDILFFNRDIIHEPGLNVPHPQLHLRRFTLKPLNDIAPQFRHPELGKTISDLLSTCPDPLTVKKL
jgi:2-amino-4-hydroxy-6-hydroxymethyldihydropteridine diphosphokinase